MGSRRGRATARPQSRTGSRALRERPMRKIVAKWGMTARSSLKECRPRARRERRLAHRLVSGLPSERHLYPALWRRSTSPSSPRHGRHLGLFAALRGVADRALRSSRASTSGVPRHTGARSDLVHLLRGEHRLRLHAIPNVAEPRAVNLDGASSPGSSRSGSTRVRTCGRSSAPASTRSTRASWRPPGRSDDPGPGHAPVVLPQALRVIVPPLGNEFNNMMKTTSLLTHRRPGDVPGR